MKRALLFNPYLDVMGGGERHVLSMMRVLVDMGYTVDIAWKDQTILTKIHDQLEINLEGFSVIPDIFSKGNSHQRDALTSQYDIFVYVTNGSYFTSRAKKNFIFAMYPLQSLYNRSLINRYKLRNYSVIANGDFTAEKIKDWLKLETYVLYPYIDQQFFHHDPRKLKTIISVGRIFQHLHSKRHDIIIEAFIKLKNEYQVFNDFQLEIIGGLKPEDQGYMDILHHMVKGRSDVSFYPNISYDQLRSHYASGMFYWHAAGFGIDEKMQPENVEHVGITPLEAMASGCVTLCYDAGGPKRYIENGTNGYLYTSVDDLIYKTNKAYADLEKSDHIVQNAQEFVSTHFSYQVFKNTATNIFKL